MPRPRTRFRVIPGVSVVALGVGLVVATILAQWGHVAYGLGVTAVAVGTVWGVVTVGRSAVWRVGLSVGSVLIVFASGVVAVTGIPSPPPRWDTPDRLGGMWSVRVGDLIISDGTARNIDTGDVAWEHDDAETMLVDTEIVVLDTGDGAVGIDPANGRQLWHSAITGSGVAYNGDTLVVAHVPSEDQHEAVALDLATGQTLWRQDGRPVMECALGPVDRFSPAREQSHVLLIGDEDRESDATLLDVADGQATVAEVNCALSALVVDEVLIEGDAQSLVGRTVSEGEQLWSALAPEPWKIIGGGPTVFTPRAGGLAQIDPATGPMLNPKPPANAPEIRIGGIVQRASQVWALLVDDSQAAMWNPGTGDLVEIPDATSIRVEGSDVSSGWITLSGTTRDLTGEESPQCWALSRDGRLSGPIAGMNCVVAEGLLQTNQGVHPID